MQSLKRTRKMCFSHVQLSISGTTLIYNTMHEIKLCVDLKLDPVPKFSVLLINTSRTCFKTAPESSTKFKNLARTGFLSKLRTRQHSLNPRKEKKMLIKLRITPLTFIQDYVPAKLYVANITMIFIKHSTYKCEVVKDCNYSGVCSFCY